METEKEVIIRIHPEPYSRDVWVLIPPMYWQNREILEAIKREIDLQTNTPLQIGAKKK